jgi:Mrp family chromosome partitioning ATPase/capsular polysaccharide biosynthesis protein
VSRIGADDDLEVMHWLRVIRRRAGTFIAVMATCLLVAIVVGLFKGGRYEATSDVLVGPPKGPQTSASTSPGAPNLAAALKTARGADVENAVRATLREAPDVSIDADSASGSISFTARGSSAEAAARAANEYANAFLRVRTSRLAADYAAAAQRLQGDIAAVQRQLATPALAADSALDQRTQLNAQLDAYQRGLNDLQVSSAVDGTGDEVLDVAVPPKQVSWPIVTYSGYAMAIGLLVGLGLVGLAEFFDRSVLGASSVLEASGLPVLGQVSPASSGANRVLTRLFGRRRVDDTSDVRPVLWESAQSPNAESLWTLRARVVSLREGLVRSLVVAGVSRDDGAAEVAANLAVALAQSGESTIMVCLDGARPVRLPVKAAEEPLLTEAVPVEGTVSARLQPVVGLSNLRIFSGPEPVAVAPGGYVTAGRLLEKLSGLSEYVVVLAPPVLTAAAALEMVRDVDGVILGVRERSTPRDALGEASRSLELSGACVLGVVLT